MAGISPISAHFQHFVAELKEFRATCKAKRAKGPAHNQSDVTKEGWGWSVPVTCVYNVSVVGVERGKF